MENWPEITKDTTIEELREIHKRIWLYAAEHGEKPETPYIWNCALCEWTKIVTNYNPDNCLVCPASRKTIGLGHVDCCNGLYSLWLYELCPINKRELALQIANIEIVDRGEENGN